MTKHTTHLLMTVSDNAIIKVLLGNMVAREKNMELFVHYFFLLIFRTLFFGIYYYYHCIQRIAFFLCYPCISFYVFYFLPHSVVLIFFQSTAMFKVCCLS